MARACNSSVVCGNARPLVLVINWIRKRAVIKDCSMEVVFLFLLKIFTSWIIFMRDIEIIKLLLKVIR